MILVTGTPGAGKTAFAKRLAEEIGATYMPLTQYVSKHHLYSRFDSKRKSKVVDYARTQKAIRNMVARTESYTIVDTHLSNGLVPEKIVRQVFVLRCHPRTLEFRLRAKRWGRSKIRENVLAELLDVCFAEAVRSYGRNRVAQLDTSRRTLSNCVISAAGALSGKARMRQLKVDWLRELEDDGSLDRYLR